VTLKAEKKKKPISQKKLMANQINGTKSPGPIDTTNSKYNATKHGLLRLGISELDNAEGHKKLLKRLMMERNPVGHTEVFLVESAALDMVRLQRARRLEAEYISSALHPPKYKDAMPTEEELYKGTLVDEGWLCSIQNKRNRWFLFISVTRQSCFPGCKRRYTSWKDCSGCGWVNACQRRQHWT
jgi:hypothetical protein